MNGINWSFVAGGLTSLLAAFAVGWFAGRSSVGTEPQIVSPTPVVASYARSGGETATPDPASAEIAKPKTADDLEAQSAYAEVLADAIQNPSGVLRALSWSSNPTETVNSIIDQMSDDELIAAVSSLSDFAKRDIKKAPDMRAYARRLSAIALGGFSSEVQAEPAPPGAEMIEVEFATKVNDGHAPEDAGRLFGEGQDRIYAVVPNSDIPKGQVLVRWSRVDQPQLMLFEKYGINRANDHSYVWFEPDDGFSQGEYRVDFYSSGGEMDHLGTGSYVVDPNVPIAQNPAPESSGS